MKKAFLSHTSHDKALVREVAELLGRPRCVYDEQAFLTGEAFKEAIERGLDDSLVFVFFVSQAALESPWVKFEVEEAWYRRVQGVITQSLVYILDSNIELKKLPSWMLRGRVRRIDSAKVIFHDILLHLKSESEPIFVGRNEERGELQQEMAPTDGTSPPHVVMLHGLPDIGRRSFIADATPKLLSLHKPVIIPIGEGDSSNDICLSVIDKVETFTNDTEFRNMVQQIRALSNKEAIEQTLDYLRGMVYNDMLPIFIDEGGLLNSTGHLQEPISELLNALRPDDPIYLFCISNSKPRLPQNLDLPVIAMKPLEYEDIKRLLVLWAERFKLQLSGDNVNELATYVAGYPKAAEYAIRQAKNYGIEVAMRNKFELVQFRVGPLSEHLQKLEISYEGREILSLLAAYSPLSFQVIAEVFPEISQENILATIIYLIDQGLIIPGKFDQYYLAEPINGAVERAFGITSEKLHKAAAHALDSVLSSAYPFQISSRLSLYRSMFRAAYLAKDTEIQKRSLRYANDLIQLAEKLYHDRHFGDAIDAATLALEERPNSEKTRGFLIRALIQLEQWEEARAYLQKHTPPKEAKFLTGFLERRQGNTQMALQTYEAAWRAGKRGVAIYRELALCHFLLGDFEQALSYVDEALLDNKKENEYMIDLRVKIATHQRDRRTAKEALELYRRISGGSFYYHHRASRVALAFNELQLARDEAKQAVDLIKAGSSAPLEIFAQLAHCEIVLHNLGEAELWLEKLDREAKGRREDVRVGLRCRLEIARGEYKKAQRLMGRIKKKDTISYLGIWRDVLNGLLSTNELSNQSRRDAEKELAELNEKLKSARPEEFIPVDIDPPTI